MKPNAKKIIKTTIHILLAITLVFAIAIGYFMIKDLNHGYYTSDAVIEKFIDSWDNNDVFGARLCFNRNSLEYAKQYTELKENLKRSNTKIHKNTTALSNITTDTQKLVQAIIEKTGLSDINDAQMTDVSFSAMRTKNEVNITYDCNYEFVTYRINNKWYIDSFKENEIKAVNLETEIIDMEIGDDLLGTLNIPNNWLEIKNDNTNVVTYMSPESDITIEIGAVDNNLTINDIITEKQKLLKEQNLDCDVYENTEINGQTCTVIQYKNGDKTYTTVMTANPLKDSYTHYIDFVCDTQDAECYYQKIFSTLRM